MARFCSPDAAISQQVISSVDRVNKMNAYRRSALSLLLAATAALAGNLDSNRYLAHIKYLASPELQGRGIDTSGIEKAAAYIERQFRECGLQPPGGIYSQSFPVVRSVLLGPGNHLEVISGGQTSPLIFRKDFTALNFSSSGTIVAPVVFAGYGITAPAYGYDDYAGIDVRGKIVLVLPHEPQADAARNALRHGAAGLIVINDFADSAPGAHETFGLGTGPVDSGIPAAEVRATLAAEWFAAHGRNLDHTREAMTQRLKPQSFALPDSFRLAMTTGIHRDIKTIRNIAGYLPGQTGEYVIIGAHYDHIGFGYEFSNSPEMAGQIHPGADDNASGTAALLELARWFASQPQAQRGILLLSFSGEEAGRLGSRYYVRHPLLPLGQAVAMINLDMIGRVRDRTIFVGSAGSGSGFSELLDEILPKHDLKRSTSEAAESGASDYLPFKEAGLPVLYFLDEMMADLHSPRDTWDKIDVPGAMDVVSAVADVAARLRNAPERPQFIAARPHVAVASAVKPARGGGLWFGIIPGAPVPIGVALSVVEPGSPAGKAGLKPGDVLVALDGKPILSLVDLGSALAGKEPGDRAIAKLLRNGVTIGVTIEFRDRPKQDAE